MLQTSVSYTVFVVSYVARQRYQRGISPWSSNEAYITIRWDTANYGASETATKSVIPCSVFG